jgi:hypothetical protein
MALLLKRFLFNNWHAFLVAVVINAIVGVNLVVHYSQVGYDIDEHLHYIIVLPNRLPTNDDTYEFFSPPLPYLIPALIDQANERRQAGMISRYWHAARNARTINYLLSLGITFLLWRTADLLRPGNAPLKLSILVTFGLLTVYYRTFSQARGEPYVAFFACLTSFLILRLLKNLPSSGWKDGIWLGLSLGLLILSRQWGFFLLPAVGLLAVLVYIKSKEAGLRFGKILLVSGLIAFAVGGWFYIYLYATYGKITAFNMESQGFNLENHPSSFYTATGLESLNLFQQPTRPVFDNNFLPLFYSDIWGDYWCYFTCIRPDELLWEDNREQISPYLGRVNLVSVLPTALLLGGFVLGGITFSKTLFNREIDPEPLFISFLFIASLSSMIGYLWFVISYPTEGASSTVKATYMIHAFLFAAVMAGILLEKIRQAKPAVYIPILLILLFIFAHNLPAMFTRYSRFAF